jgi:hypothetical protein
MLWQLHLLKGHTFRTGNHWTTPLRMAKSAELRTSPTPVESHMRTRRGQLANVAAAQQHPATSKDTTNTNGPWERKFDSGPVDTY